MIVKRDETFMCVCELLTPIRTGETIIGTGTFVGVPASDNTLAGWIITASHVALRTTQNTQIIISTKEGKSRQLPLTALGPLNGWKHHTIADISAFHIFFSPDIEEFIDGRFFPFTHFNVEQKAVSRDYELTSVGFPQGLGTEGYFSPFTFRSYASSSFVTLLRADTKTPCVFFCLENPSMGGYSGCPVFDLGYSFDGTMLSQRGETICHGIMHGTMSDNTGGKIAMVTPAFYLRDLISIM